jgi:hypothetical protein
VRVTVQAGEQPVEVLHGAGAEKRAGHTGVGDGERHGEVGHRETGLLSERDELLDDVDTSLIVEVADQSGAAQFVDLVLPHAAGEESLAEWAPDQVPHPEALDGGQHLTLDSAIEEGVARLFGAEPLEAAPFGDPLSLDDAGRRGVRRSDGAHLAAVDQVRQRREGFFDISAGVGVVELVPAAVTTKGQPEPDIKPAAKT